MVRDEISQTQLQLKHQLHCCYHLSEAIGFKDHLNNLNLCYRSPTIIMAEDREKKQDVMLSNIWLVNYISFLPT